MSRWLPARDEVPAPRGAPALFLDRDGAIIHDRDYLADPSQVELYEGVAAQLRRARGAGYLLVCVSNQSGLGRGRFGPSDLDGVMARLHELLAAEDAALHGYFYCPHAPEADCRCRKPKPGLLEEAAAAFAWDPAGSWVLGDKLSDVELGRRAGLRTALVRTGYGIEAQRELADPTDVLLADDLAAALAAILDRA